MGKKPIDQSLHNELSWYLSTLKYLQEGIEMVKEQRELLDIPLDLSINLISPKRKEDLMVLAQKAETQLRKGEKDPLVYLYTKLAVDHFRELRSYIRRNHPKNKTLDRFISAVQKQQSLDTFVDHMAEGLNGLIEG
ncbi:MAG: hypothetical protein ACW96U_13310 [Candidatus Heimdallarchaeaceae archaeon]